MKLLIRSLFKLFCLSFFYILCISCHESKQEISLKFPQDYFGNYKGTLQIDSKNGTQEVPMQFKLQPTDTVGKYNYTLIYGEGEMYQERKYSLIEKDKETGMYVVDENNGILLDDKVIGNKMYALFEVNENLLTTFITFESDHLIFEIVFANKREKRTTFSNDSIPVEVISYPIATIQRAILQKEK